MILIYLLLAIFIIGAIIQTVTFYIMRRMVKETEESSFLSLISHNWSYIRTLKLFHKALHSDHDNESAKRNRRTITIHYAGLVISLTAAVLLTLKIINMI